MTYSAPTPTADRLTDRAALDADGLTPAEARLKEALAQVDTPTLIEWRDAPEQTGNPFWETLLACLRTGAEVGPLVADASRAHRLLCEVLADRQAQSEEAAL